MPRTIWISILLSAALSGACAASRPSTEQVAAALGRPIDCANGERDIAVLQAERASLAEYVSAGMRTVEPGPGAARVLGLGPDPEWVATAKYGQRLGDAITGIRRVCSLPAGQMSEDGLAQVTDAKVGYSAIRPGTDLSQFRRLIVLPVRISFKKTRATFDLSERQVDRLREEFHRAFVRELEERGGYDVVSTPGPDVLLVVPALIEVEVKVPPEPVSARDRIYISEAGRVTLVAEFRDSATGLLLGRAADRREIGTYGNELYQSSPVGHTADIRRLFSYWASLLRASLDEAHELAPLRERG